MIRIRHPSSPSPSPSRLRLPIARCLSLSLFCLVCLLVSINLPHIQALHHSASNRRGRSGALIQLQSQAQAQLDQSQSHAEAAAADTAVAADASASASYTITQLDSYMYCNKYGTIATSLTCCSPPRTSISLLSVCNSLGYNRLTVTSSSTLSNNICAKNTDTEQMYGLDLTQYCMEKGYSQAFVVGTGQASIPKTVWSWVCRGSTTNVPKADYPLSIIDFNTICRIKSINGVTGRPTYSDEKDPYSWKCAIKAQFQPITNTNIAPYCLNISTSVCGGSGKAEASGNTWLCVGQRTVDFTTICTGKGMKYDASQANKGIYKCV